MSTKNFTNTSTQDKPSLETFTRNYESGEHPTSFAGISKLEQYYPKLSSAKIKEYLATIDTYSRFADYKKITCFNPTFVYETRTNYQADLLQVSSLAKFNRNVNFILILIDVFSRKVWAEPIKRKSMEMVSVALDSIFNSITRKKKSIMCTDRGTEFLNVKVRKVAREHKVTMIQSQNEKCPIVERVIYSIKRLIYKYLDSHETKLYVNKLPKLIEVYNTRIHRSLNCSPEEADQLANKDTILARHRENIRESLKKCNIKRPKQFSIGDVVRITRAKSLFSRGYEEKRTDEVFRVTKILSHMPIPMYSLSEYDHTPIEGKFYANELTKYSGGLYKIENILQRRTRKGVKEMLVKWRSYNSKYNSWIPELNVEKQFKQDESE